VKGGAGQTGRRHKQNLQHAHKNISKNQRGKEIFVEGKRGLKGSRVKAKNLETGDFKPKNVDRNLIQEPRTSCEGQGEKKRGGHQLGRAVLPDLFIARRMIERERESTISRGKEE